MVVSFSYHPRCTRSPSCWKREEYLSWLYSNEAFNPAALNQSDRNEYVSHYSAPGGMHAGFEYYRASHRMPVLALGGYILTLGGNITMPTIIYGMKILAQNVL